LPNLEAKTVVATTTCADCGKPVRVVLNKNGMAYYFCPHVDSDVNRCNHKQQWGRTTSQQMQRDFLAARKSQAKETPANDNHAPEPNRADVPANENHAPSSERNDGPPAPDKWDTYAQYT
jgi:hypothetical protein